MSVMKRLGNNHQWDFLNYANFRWQVQGTTIVRQQRPHGIARTAVLDMVTDFCCK
jgi:hypothetical protein